MARRRFPGPRGQVVLCSHVLYNVRDIGPCVYALHEHARRRVVLEITARHPLSGLNPRWRRFHASNAPGVRPSEDALSAIRALGIELLAEVCQRPAAASAISFSWVV